MRTSIRIAALLLGGAMFIGCDNKDNTTVAPPPTAPDTSKVTDAATSMADTAKTDAKNAADSAKTGMQNATDAAKTDVKNAADATKTGVQNATDAAKTEAKRMLPTSMPSLPAMPK